MGAGWINQVAALPAFKNASKNSNVVALVSGDSKKRNKLGKAYGIEKTYGYEEYDKCLASGDIDAVYIGLPNSMHCDYTVRAAKAGIHVLCEKPMAISEDECKKMIQACEKTKVNLMIAYRLHFETANLSAIALTQSKKLGEPRLFSSIFTPNVEAGNIRLKSSLGGGPFGTWAFIVSMRLGIFFKTNPLT